MKIKFDADGKPVMDGDKIVYVADDGKEFQLDAGHLYGRVRDLTTENAGHRGKLTEATDKLKLFEGIEDPAAAIKALETVASLDSGALIAAGKVDEIKTAAKLAAEAQIADALKASKTQLAEAQEAAAKATSELYAERIGGAFARSKYIAEKIAVPADMLQATFGGDFKIEDGKMVAYDGNGAKIYSRANPGELAGFEEAIELRVSAYANRDNILKGEIKDGGGAKNPDGTPKIGGKTMARTEFERLSPAEKATKMKEGYTLREG